MNLDVRIALKNDVNHLVILGTPFESVLKPMSLVKVFLRWF